MAAGPEAGGGAGRLAGRRVLVVEDEMIVAMMIEDVLGDHGAAVLGPATGVAAAIEALGDEAPDVALLDLNLAGEGTEPVARELARRGIPFAFATGYGAAGVPPEFQGRPVLQKPFREEELLRALEEALSPGAGR